MLDQAGVTTTAVSIDHMLTAIVLLAKDYLASVSGKLIEGSHFVRFEVVLTCDVEEFERVSRLCKHGAYGVTVDAGKFQEAFRQVSRIVDEARRRSA